ncbi:MAG: SocA family protein [Synergistaceae bacterium]|nr:SocA family protein [Synergistaceae bacterium]
MITAKELARYIISTIKQQMTDIQPEEFDVTPLKLQKLLYYCQGYSLALTGKPAFDDPIEAWKFGPVVESVYQEYKKYEGGIIPYGDIEAETLPDDTLQSIVNFVLADKGQYSGETLARMTHKESPWRDSYQMAYGGVYMNAKISHNALQDYFASEFLRREEDYEDEDVFWNTVGTKVSKERMEAAIAEL